MSTATDRAFLDKLLADPLNPDLCRQFGVEVVKAPREIAPWWEGRLLDPRDGGQIEKAALVADGKLPGEGLVICPSQSYFGGPSMFHPHPQGWPCFTSCYIPERES